MKSSAGFLFELKLRKIFQFLNFPTSQPLTKIFQEGLIYWRIISNFAPSNFRGTWKIAINL